MSEDYIAGLRAKQTQTLRATIREAECIGCTKCISACPVDAIVGRAKRMHTVIAAECTGCELCVAPCPVDCIDMQPIAAFEYDKDKANQRYHARHARLESIQANRSKRYQKAVDPVSEKRDYIAQAIARVNAKRANMTETSDEPG